MEGQGELTFSDGRVYRGRFSKGVADGDMEILTDQYSFVGNVSQGVVEGRGSIKYESGELYEGEFRNNLR